jgi:hypothetical protein
MAEREHSLPASVGLKSGEAIPYRTSVSYTLKVSFPRARCQAGRKPALAA